ncbi:MAG: ATP-dependent Clp protease ATP-binding subunit ClpB, partial [Candidatus Promineifilaceae bacterium]
QASKNRLDKLEEELANLKDQSTELTGRWQAETEAIQTVQTIKEEIDSVRVQIEQAERQTDLQKAAELRYSVLRQLEEDLAKAELRLRKLHSSGALLKEEVDGQDIAFIISRWTGIPASKLLEGETEKLVYMEERMHQRVVGQNEAITAVAAAVRRSRSGLSDPNRPIGSFIFLGPTGVGKTETARALAEFLFDDEHNIVRIDMSEFQERHTVARLIGAPPGYVGFDEGGQLTEKVRRRPYSVVLFDEIEKAHPEVFNVLLQVLDDGRLTDGKGRTIDFRNTVIVMTSNIGSQFILEIENKVELDRRVGEALRNHFRPEFLNRVDETIIFHRLEKVHLRHIIDIQLASIRKRLLTKGITIELTQAATDLLIEGGYDPAYGARPLKRILQLHVVDGLAARIIQGDVLDGDHVLIDLDDDELSFVVEDAAEAEFA